MHTREILLAVVKGALEAHPDVLAAWESGSAAFDALDDYSDLDVSAVVRPGSEASVFAAVELDLKHLEPIEQRYEVPQPSWHGHEQCFYRLANTSPYHMIDLALMRADSKDLFLDPRRHGTPRTLFDRAEVMAKAPREDVTTWRVRLAARAADLQARFGLFQPLVIKEARRGRPVDALAFYHSLTLRPLVELLRILHAPWRYDFGLRYVARDLPDEAAALIQDLTFVHDLADLEAKQARAAAWFEREVAALDLDHLKLD